MHNTWVMGRVLASTVAALVCLVATSAAGEADDSYYPGLPVLRTPDGYPDAGLDNVNVNSWLNAPCNGLTGSRAAKQWTRIPVGALASNIQLFTCTADGFGGSVVCPPSPRGKVDFGTQYYANAFVVSPAGSREPYGLGHVVTVRTVAFGSIPVEADVQVRQARSADGLPVPLVAEFADIAVRNGEAQHAELLPGTLKGRVSLGMVGLRVDGIDVGLTGTCATPDTDLSITSKLQVFEDMDTLTRFTVRESVNGTTGGSFSGTITIPAFAGCTTGSGDDVSRLLTAALSGPSNPVSVSYGSTFCGTEFNENGTFKPTPPGADTPAKAGCFQFQYMPENPDLWAIPLPWPIPGRAP